MKGRILLVDDDADILDVLGDRLTASGHSVTTARDGLEALDAIRTDPPDLMLLDLQMPRMGGMELLEKIKQEDLDITTVVLTAVGTIQKAVEAMRNGAYDFLTKPFDPQHVVLVVAKALERVGLRRENRFLSQQARERRPKLIGDSPAMVSIIRTARKAAAARASTLILGESGTGKEVLARSIHDWSDRSGCPFIAVNCVALPVDLLESELFGHEKGAFTGAIQRKIGRFEMADGGSIFLDEIAELKDQPQAKLLRVLQEHRLERVGGTREIEVDLRVIAATNRNLTEAVADGSFREDLYYRLNVITITMPPLRDRKEDIGPLAEHFIAQISNEAKRGIPSMSPVTLDHLLRYDWPGNVRELRNTLERAIVLGTGDAILPEDLPYHILDFSPSESTGVENRAGGSFHEQVRHLKRSIIEEALRKTNGHHRKAADLLGLNPTYLSRLVRTLGLRT